MPEETISTPETTAPAPEAAQPAPDDSGTWDMDRGMRTITTLREIEGSHKSTIHTLRSAVAAMAAGRTDLPEGLADAMRAPASAAPTAEVEAYAAAFGEIGAALGIAYNGVDTKPLLDAARASRLSAEAGRAIQAKGLDDRLTRAVLDLSSVDLTAGADAIRASVEEAVDRCAFESPNLRVRTQSAIVSGAPHLSGQAGMPSTVTREQMKFMSASEIVQASKAGLVEGISAHR